MEKLRALWRAANALAAMAGALFVGGALAAPPPAELFARDPALLGVAISPSGKRVAMITLLETGRRGVAVMDLPIKGPAQAVAAFADANVVSVRWINDERLVFEAFQPGARIIAGGAGTFAVNHDGSNQRQLVTWRETLPSTGTRLGSKMLPYGWFLLGSLDDGSDDIIVQERIVSGAGESAGSRIGRLNTLTGALKILSYGAPASASDWVFDKQSELRVVREVRDGRDRLFARQPGTDTWTMLEDAAENGQSGMRPVYMENDDEVVVESYAGRNTPGYYIYNLKKRQLDAEPLMVMDRFDIGSIETDDQAHHVVGVHSLTDRPTSVWFNARLAGVQKAVDSALPAGRFNTVHCGRCETTPFYVVRSTSDRQPGEYYVYDQAKRALTRLGAVRPWIDESQQGRRTFHWITARDGMAIPVVVTHPAGRRDDEALPAVLMVHGGPWLRGVDRQWESEAQFLASRGYRVIEPDFRGSTGYGWKHFQAGWKQWGLAMQDDLADAVLWAGKQGLVDPQRVCIYGGSYGGYAALMGPIRNPELYRCAASFAGVTDIELMFSSAQSDMSDQSKRYSMPVLIGDPKTDAEQLQRASPIQRVAEIKVPVLLVQGTLDRRVPRENANKFEAAARRAGVAIERVDYNDDAHGWNEPKDHADFLNRLDQFLAKSLGR